MIKYRKFKKYLKGRQDQRINLQLSKQWKTFKFYKNSTNHRKILMLLVEPTKTIRRMTMMMRVKVDNKSVARPNDQPKCTN